MGERYMTMAEIEAAYPNEWLLIERPKLTRSHDVLGGYVVLHSGDRYEFDRRLRETREERHARPPVPVAFLYTGHPDPNDMPPRVEVEE